MDCHSNRDLSLTFASGETLSVFVNQGAMAASVHGDKLSCTDCHREITGFPHRSVPALTKRDYSIGQYTLCRNCHFTEYTKTLDSMHFRTLTQGDSLAPLCTDCHDYHAVSPPNEPRSKVSSLCGKCHDQVYNLYATSVHGAALLESGNQDVPVCTDCHQTHSFADTSTTAFHLDVPLLCARCHSDPALAAKYGMKANVYGTYTRDFHGTTVLFARAAATGGDVEVAVCTDCHGIHAIGPLNEGTAQETRQKALARCQQCHAAAGQNFPDAWLGHFEINPTDTPAVWLVRVAYWTLIPYMLLGLALFIFADLWRARRRRRGDLP
ncbi:MAG: cytochrome c3 family protein [Chloroflexota bacterium]